MVGGWWGGHCDLVQDWETDVFSEVTWLVSGGEKLDHGWVSCPWGGLVNAGEHWSPKGRQKLSVSIFLILPQNVNSYFIRKKELCSDGRVKLDVVNRDGKSRLWGVSWKPTIQGSQTEKDLPYPHLLSPRNKITKELLLKSTGVLMAEWPINIQVQNF